MLPLEGSPWCELILEPEQGIVRLRSEYQTPEPDIARLKNVSFSGVLRDGRELAELTVTVDDSVHSAYGLLAMIADEVQLGGAPLAPAVATAIAHFKDVLAPRTGLSDAKEVGLFGELKLLEFLLGELGPERAIAAWQGPMSEEHDFVLADAHFEVKTTTAERRIHVIGGVNQLVPIGNTPLVLVSLQVTRSTHDSGETLSSLVAKLRAASAAHSVEFDRRVERAGWHVDDANLYTSYWNLRSVPRAYSVDELFPALTPEILKPAVPQYSLVSDVTYRVDVTDLSWSAPNLLSRFVEGA